MIRLPRPIEALLQRWRAILWLVAVWCLLWGSVHPGTVAAGLLVALGVLTVGRLPRIDGSGRGHPLLALRFVLVFLRQLVAGSVTVARQVVQPRGELHRAVVAVPVRGASDPLLTLVGNVVSLTPGTLTLEVDRPRNVLYVHVLHAGDVEEVRRSIRALEALAVRAFGSPAARAALREQEAVT